MSQPAKLRVIIDDNDIRKLILPSGIPDTIQELETVIREKFQLSGNFNLHYKDAEFGDFFSLTTTTELSDKDTIKVAVLEPVVLNFTTIDSSERISPSSTDSSIASPQRSSGASPAVPLVSFESSDDTLSMCSQGNYGLRSQHWPSVFVIPQFSYDAELTLKAGNKNYYANGVLLSDHNVKSQISDKLVKIMFEHCAYPSSKQICAVAQELIKKHPCLKEPGSISGYDGWLSRLKYKMASYRKKLKRLGCPELTSNSTKQGPSAVKKPRRAEINYLPPHPEGETAQTLEEIRLELLEDIKIRNNGKVVSEKMARTFSIRRKEIVEDSPPIDLLTQRWPALFHLTQIKEEFKRLTTVDVESTFIGNLDKYTDQLFHLFRIKGGSAGYKIRDVMKLLDQDHSVNIRREVVIRCLIVHLSENPENLIAHYLDNNGEMYQQEMVEHTLKIVTRGGSPDGSSLKAEIVLEGAEVLGGLSSVADACVALFGLMYCLNLSYPKSLRYTFEFFQKILLELDSAKLSPKILTLKNKMLY